jgi:hypothetical protein
MMIPKSLIYVFMDLTLREEYWIKFYMKFIAMISNDNYYTQFYQRSFELAQ